MLKVYLIAKNSLGLLGGPFPSPQTPYAQDVASLSQPDFASKVRPAGPSGLRPYAFAAGQQPEQFLFRPIKITFGDTMNPPLELNTSTEPSS